MTHLGQSGSALTICDKCGRVEEPGELMECILRGVDALICLHCVAEFWPWIVEGDDD